MAKMHLDRIKKRYGWEGENYRELMRQIIGHNTQASARAIGRLLVRDIKFTSKKIPSQIIMPDVTQVLPKQSIFIRKGADRGALMADNLRDKLTKDLRQVLSQPTYFTTRGKLKEDLIIEFEQKIRDTFQSYTKKDPSIGIPANVATIARTEIRSVVSTVKHQYMDRFQKVNPDIVLVKEWIHNSKPYRGYKPREHHRYLDKTKIKYNEQFVLKNERTGTTYYADHPHAENLPPEEVINCQCEIRYLTSQIPVTKSMTDFLVEKDKKPHKEGDKMLIWGKPHTYSESLGKFVLDGSKPKEDEPEEDHTKEKAEALKDKLSFMTFSDMLKMVRDDGLFAEYATTSDGIESFIKDRYTVKRTESGEWELVSPSKYKEETKEETSPKDEKSKTTSTEEMKDFLSSVRSSSIWDKLREDGLKDVYDDSPSSMGEFFSTYYTLDPLPSGKTPAEMRTRDLYERDPLARLKLIVEEDTAEHPSYVDKDFGTRDYWSEDFAKKTNNILKNNTPRQTVKQTIDALSKTTAFRRNFVDKKDAESYVNKVNNFVNDHPITYRFHADEIGEKLLASGRTKNLHETGTGHGSISVSARSGWEHAVIDYSNRKKGRGLFESLDKGERPSYAMIGAPQSFERGAGSQYGLSTFILKDEVKDRCTFTIGNSSGTQGSFTKGNAHQILDKSRVSHLGINVDTFRRVNDGYTYLECQIMGQVQLDKDVAGVALSGKEWNRMSSNMKNSWRKMADKYGWELKKPDGTVLYDPKKKDERLVHVEEEAKKHEEKLAKRESALSEPPKTVKAIRTWDPATSSYITTYKVKTSKYTWALSDKDGKRITEPKSGKTRTKRTTKVEIGGIEERADGSKWMRTSKFTYKKVD
jgi:hypothetical protein